MTQNIQREISRAVPDNIPIRFSVGSTPLFTAYGCVLFERDTGKSYVYTAVNLISGKREVLSRRPSPLTTSGVEAMAERIRRSSVAGAGRLEADRPFGEKIALVKCQEMLTVIFNEILPRHGYAVRAEQIALAKHILDAISRRSVSLAEAEVGTGKTLAYLVPAILAKRGRLGGFWNMSFYTGTPYVEMAHMPIIVATSSIALQKAIVTDYIPELSDILLEHGVIKTPLTSVIRKGREHYVCERNLRAHIPFEHDAKMKYILESLLEPFAPIDLAEIDGLTAHAKRKIAVPDRCRIDCPYHGDCPYLCFREQAQSATIDIQVCNHNYLLADTLRRADGQRPLIPNYQSIIIDEAHKFLQAARSMYGVEFSNLTLPEIKDSVSELTLKHGNAERLVRETSAKLSDESRRLFRRLTLIAQSGTDEEADRFAVEIDIEAARHIRNIRDIADRLHGFLIYEPVADKDDERKSKIIWDLVQIREQIAAFTRRSELICWLQTDDDAESRLCAIPKDLDKRLFNDLWSKGIPTILTSGTLSAGGDFSHIKRTLGLERVGCRLTETSKPSPFDYRKNALLYISENVPFPDQRDKEYIAAVTNEIERLIFASHGHAAVLFTSYNTMGLVYTALKHRGIPFPMFRLDKGGIREIERFKQSGNGILFASGALWEGIDIPGDALSMLIIVKLPFPVPDPISEYERSLYKDMNEYKNRVIVPECMIKTKQGFGRPFRSEKDTGCVAIFDSRVNSGGAYRFRVIAALPSCRVTDSIGVVEHFFRMMKSPEYFK